MDISEPVAGYYRISVARDDMHAPELYEDEIRRYCSYRKLTLAHTYSDIDRSAFRGAPDRPSLSALIEDRKNYSAIIIPKLSRFGRSMKQLIELFEIFDSDNIPLVFLDMNLDTSTSQGRLLRHILAAFAEYESDVKADYSRANNRQRALSGRPPLGTPPMGYARENQDFVIVGSEAQIVRDIFDLYLSGSNLTQIALTLNRSGRLRRSGVPWSHNKVAKALECPAYAALRRVDDELVLGSWEPIVARDAWDRAQALLEEAREHRTDRRATSVRGLYLLSALIYCTCGKKLYRHKVGTRRVAYECRDLGRVGCKGERITQSRADDFVTAAILERFPSAEVRDLRGNAVIERPMAELWAELTTPARREIISLVVARIDLLPRTNPDAIPHEDRRLSIEWNDAWRDDDRRARIPVPVMPLTSARTATCTHCGNELPILDFHVSSKAPGGFSSRCKSCSQRRSALARTGYTVDPVRNEARSPSGPPKTWAEWRRERLLPN